MVKYKEVTLKDKNTGKLLAKFIVEFDTKSKMYTVNSEIELNEIEQFNIIKAAFPDSTPLPA